MCGRSEWVWRASGVCAGAAVTSFPCDVGYVNEGCGRTRFTVTAGAAAALMTRQSHRIASVILFDHRPRQLRYAICSYVDVLARLHADNVVPVLRVRVVAFVLEFGTSLVHHTGSATTRASALSSSFSGKAQSSHSRQTDHLARARYVPAVMRNSGRPCSAPDLADYTKQELHGEVLLSPV